MRAEVWEHPGAALGLALARQAVENLQEFLRQKYTWGWETGKVTTAVVPPFLIHRVGAGAAIPIQQLWGRLGTQGAAPHCEPRTRGTTA